MEFQSYAYGKNHWLLDPDIKPVLGQVWKDFPQNEGKLAQFGVTAGGPAYELADYVDRSAQPELVMHDLDGNRIDRVRLAPRHARLLQEMAFINRPPYQGGSWHEHFALGYLLADTGLYCSLIVTNQTAYAIYKYAPGQKSWLEPLLNGDAWGATWMTETQGGSDLGANRTAARQQAGQWRLFGDDKYFASNAGLADIAVVTARPQGAPAGPKGIALFLVPRLDENDKLNFKIRRLKRKSATRAVPTGEVEFDNSLAYLVGEAGLGIYYTLENLTVSRLANAVGAMGLSHKAHLETLFRVRSRSAFGLPLASHPLIRRDLTDLALRMAGGLALVFHAVQAFDLAWKETPPYSSGYHYARFLSHLAKNRTAEHSVSITQSAMELFGGLGFLEDFAISRLHRESLVTAIWEGGSNIQALDMLESIQKKAAHESFLDEFVPMLEKAGTPAARRALETLEISFSQLTRSSSEEAQWLSKDYLRVFADIIQVALLYRLAETSGERYSKLAGLYADHFLLHNPYPAWVLNESHLWFPLNLDL
jgi:acyl-CoA dehydrogenase